MPEDASEGGLTTRENVVYASNKFNTRAFSI